VKAGLQGQMLMYRLCDCAGVRNGVPCCPATHCVRCWFPPPTWAVNLHIRDVDIGQQPRLGAITGLTPPCMSTPSRRVSILT
jgi:hypothetical protein